MGFALGIPLYARRLQLPPRRGKKTLSQDKQRRSAVLGNNIKKKTPLPIRWGEGKGEGLRLTGWTPRERSYLAFECRFEASTRANCVSLLCQPDKPSPLRRTELTGRLGKAAKRSYDQHQRDTPCTRLRHALACLTTRTSQRSSFSLARTVNAKIPPSHRARARYHPSSKQSQNSSRGTKHHEKSSKRFPREPEQHQPPARLSTNCLLEGW